MEQSSSGILDSYDSTENVLMESFKAAALKVTTHYKDSLVQNRRAYTAGYKQALQDLYGALSTCPENDSLSVEELLCFARQKNTQLNEEMSIRPIQNIFPQKEEKTNTLPFQIDPHSQFTFTFDLPRSSEGFWDNTDEFKIRKNANELMFMGRPLNAEASNEPPFKRNRPKREEPYSPFRLS